ncbi:MAG: hypothetical protein GY720_02685, partial [bacterium]|nr:hypothetical protein [bacterium]
MNVVSRVSIVIGVMGGLLLVAAVVADSPVSAEKDSPQKALSLADVRTRTAQTPNTALREPVSATANVPAADARSGEVKRVMTNRGPAPFPVFTGHVLTAAQSRGGGAILYAPTEADNPTFRADVAALGGGACDYYDPRVSTPTLAELQAYSCVFTWVNYAYADAIGMGDVLADYLEA